MPADIAAAMDRMYRHQRHVYDATRKFYLFGRDRLIAELEPARGDRVLEIGCGTARNLIRLARRHPGIALYGVDASAEMLKTAEAAIARAGLTDRITLRRSLGEVVDPRGTFGLDRPFDKVICCYALSMMPAWPTVIESALANLKTGGRLDIVDFWNDWPAWARKPLAAWLALFDVKPRVNLGEMLRQRAARRGGHLTVARLLGGYAFHITYWK